LPLVMYKSELEDILAQFSKKIKDSRRPHPEVDDNSGKLSELEHRINGIWKTHNELSGTILELERVQTSFSRAIGGVETVKLPLLEEKVRVLEALSNNFSAELKRIPSKPDLSREVPVVQNEQFFRSMILSLRADIKNMQDELNAIKSVQAESPLPLDSPIALMEIQEPIPVGALQNVLKQHDAAIRHLASRLQLKDDRPTLVEASNYLSHLEILRSEMKEIISKQEDTKKLTTQDIDIIQKILSSLDTKIGKEDLTQMAEKNELHKIYRLLKKKIDELADVVRNKEPERKEDAFFVKRKKRFECASCGQLLPDKNEGKCGHESWNRFPSKTPSYGVGFSRILSSLVQTPTGDLALPREVKSSLEETKESKEKNRKRKTSSRVQTGFIKKS
jgi:hypothetical protein